MTDYAFATTWDLAAPIDRVSAVLADYEHWHEWLPAVRRAALVEPAVRGDGEQMLDVTIRGVLPYELTFRLRITQAEPPHLLELAATGDLDGIGRWTLAEEAGVTTLRFEWRVTTTRAWMNALAPLARPVFAWNHDMVMTAAGRGLAKQLGARLLVNESGPVERRSPTATAVRIGTGVVLVAGLAALVVRRAARSVD